MKKKLCVVLPGSPAEKAGMRAGDALTHIDENEIRDIIDYQFFIARKNPKVDYERDGVAFSKTVLKGEGEPLGIEFENILMDGTRRCANKCVFCFVDQMPCGHRETLYEKDDDWRLSLISGNYVTLTNLSKREMQRIADRQVSPLYISIHATDGAVRAQMMGNKNAAKIMDDLRFLRDNGIEFHAQVVVCPGINDGEILRKTLSDALSLENCISIALVPVGLTMHRDDLFRLKAFSKEDALNTLSILSEFDQTRAFASDECYLKAKIPLPPYEDYRGFPQIENGVGLLRLFEEDYLYGRDELSEVKPGKAVILTGFSAAGFMQEMVAQYPIDGVEVEIIAVENRFFGKTITVTGLLTGSDLLREGSEIICDRLLISDCTLKADEDFFLDDMTLEQVKTQMKSPLHVAFNDGESFAYALAGMKFARE